MFVHEYEPQLCCSYCYAAFWISSKIAVDFYTVRSYEPTHHSSNSFPLKQFKPVGKIFYSLVTFILFLLFLFFIWWHSRGRSHHHPVVIASSCLIIFALQALLLYFLVLIEYVNLAICLEKKLINVVKQLWMSDCQLFIL